EHRRGANRVRTEREDPLLRLGEACARDHLHGARDLLRALHAGNAAADRFETRHSKLLGKKRSRGAAHACSSEPSSAFFFDFLGFLSPASAFSASGLAPCLLATKCLPKS